MSIILNERSVTEEVDKKNSRNEQWNDIIETFTQFDVVAIAIFILRIARGRSYP